MKRFVLFAFFASSLAIADWNGDVVYFIAGAPLPPQTSGINQATRKFVDLIKSNNNEAFIKVAHNSEWLKICDKIKALRKINFEGKTILAGHSYGAQAVVTISHCLRKDNITVDLALTLDSIQKLFGADSEIIPENVKTNFNYYETKDPLLQGKRSNHREDGTFDGIVSVEVRPPFIETPHFGMVHKLMYETTEVEDRVLEVLRK